MKITINRNLDAPEGGGANIMTGLPNMDNDNIVPVDLDKLSDPEGNLDPMGDDINFETLPNLDNKLNKEFNIKNENENNEANENEANDNKDQNQNLDKNLDQNKNQETPASLEDMKLIYTRMKNKYGESFEIPDDLNSPDEFLDYVDNFVSEVNKIDLNPEALKLDQALKNGVNFQEYVERFNSISDYAKLDDRSLVALDLKDSYKWDDDKIKASLDKMENSGYLEVEAEKIRTQLNQNQEKLLSQMEQNKVQERDTHIKTLTTQREQYIKKSLDYLKNVDEVYGISVSQSEKAEFAETFRNLVTPDATGTAPLMKALQSDETLIKVAYMLAKGDAKFREAIHNAKEGVKADWRKKLDPEPKITKTSGSYEPGAVDLDALSAPAR